MKMANLACGGFTSSLHCPGYALMLRIRLQRTGRSNTPTYRLVVADKDNPIKGKFLEVVGHYLPAREAPVVQLVQERITHWIGKGALPTDTVARLLKKNGMKDMEKYMARYKHQKSKKAPTEEQAAAAAPASDTAPAAS